ncbi:hypothetical protein KKE92_04900 [Candidatus Micrarchaeota archaeon]|nr:hypothetical protein [Candidatus Micrarchaeota archaeon]
MAQSIAKTYAQSAPDCSALRRAAFRMGLLKTDPREFSKILGKNIPQESSEFGVRIVALSPTLVKKLSLTVAEHKEGFSMEAQDGFCYLYNTARIGQNLVVKVNDDRYRAAYFVFHKKDGSKDVKVKPLGRCGAGQTVARIGLEVSLRDTRYVEVYICNNLNGS